MIYLTLMIEFFDRAKFPEGNDDVLKFLKKWFNQISHKTRKGVTELGSLGVRDSYLNRKLVLRGGGI